jgi:pimeloyl-ACP methyl ester carboxylesterase
MIGRLGLLALLLLGSACAHAESAPQDRMIDVAPGVQIHVTSVGAPTAKPPLVLIPGWSATADIWRGQVEAFSSDRQVVALDPRSQGASTKTAHGDTPEQRAQDLEAVLAALDLKGAVLVGWSQGAQDVAAYVGRYGTGRLKGAVLVDTAISPGAAGIANQPEAAAQQFRLLSIYATHPHEYLDGMFHAIIGKALPQAEIDRLVAAAELTPPAIGVAQLVADMFGVDRTATLAKFDRPTLVIASSSSSELDAQKAMAARLPQGRFVAIEGAQHAVFVDQPERFDALLRDFVEGLG